MALMTGWLAVQYKYLHAVTHDVLPAPWRFSNQNFSAALSKAFCKDL